jgi:hypothetical protein
MKSSIPPLAEWKDVKECFTDRMFSRPFPDDAESKGRGFVEKQNRCETMIL